MPPGAELHRPAADDDGLVHYQGTSQYCSGHLDGGDWAECKSGTVTGTFDAGELHERQLAWDTQRDCDESDGGTWTLPLTLPPALGGGDYVLACAGGRGVVTRRDGSGLPAFPPYTGAEALRHEQRRAHTRWFNRCVKGPHEPEVVGGCRFSCTRDRAQVDAVDGQRCPISELRPRPVGDFPLGGTPN